MYSTVILLVLASSVSVCLGQSIFNCTGLANGNYSSGMSCYSYTTCLNGVGTDRNCTGGTVFDNNSGTCKSPSNVPPPCGTNGTNPCNGKADGTYPVLPNCYTYFSCKNGTVVAYGMCFSLLNLLVYDTRIGMCNLKYLVPKPCGTSLFGL